MLARRRRRARRSSPAARAALRAPPRARAAHPRARRGARRDRRASSRRRSRAARPGGGRGRRGAAANLGYTELRAPFAGTIQARRVEPGDLVGPGQPLLELEGERARAPGEPLRGGGARARGRPRAPRSSRASARRHAPRSPRSRPAAIRSRTGAACARACGRRTSELRTRRVRAARGPRAAPAGAGGRGCRGARSSSAATSPASSWPAAGTRRAALGLARRAGRGPLSPCAPGSGRSETVIDAPGALRDGQAVEVQP